MFYPALLSLLCLVAVNARISRHIFPLTPPPELWFDCGNGYLVLKSFECDGDNDCAPGETFAADEQNCEAKRSRPRSIVPGVYRCESSLFIPSFFVCDGDEDCPAGDDERNCSTRSRPSVPTTKPTDVVSTQSPIREIEDSSNSANELQTEVRRLDRRINNLTEEFNIFKRVSGYRSRIAEIMPRGLFDQQRISRIPTFEEILLTPRRPTLPDILSSGSRSQNSDSPFNSRSVPTRPNILLVLPATRNQNCGGVIQGSEGRITSPSFPETYPPNTQCKWEIIAPVGHRINLRFQQFKLEDSILDICLYDYLSVQVTSHKSSNPTTTYCGSELPPVITSQDNKMEIIMKTDISNEYEGFVASFTTERMPIGTTCFEDDFKCNETGSCIPRRWTDDKYDDCGDGSDVSREKRQNGNEEPRECFHEVSSSNRELRSPNYPSQYPSDYHCSWKFNVNPGHKINLTFIDVQMELSKYCEADRLVFYDGPSKRSPLVRSICGPPNAFITEPLISSNNALFMTFITDQSLQKRGFKIKHNTVCGGTMQADQLAKILHSHAGSDVVNENTENKCDWLIEAKEGHGIDLKFQNLVTSSDSNEELEMEILEECANDVTGDCAREKARVKYCEDNSVKVFDGADTSSPLLGMFCGNETPPRVVSEGRRMLVQFRTTAQKGLSFLASYKESQEEDQETTAV